MKRYIFLAFLVLIAAACGPTMCGESEDSKTCLRVLFIGNSYTYVNDLPAEFSALSGAGGHKVETGMAAEGGLTFSDQVNSSQARDKLRSEKWDFVVLQEQSQIPAVEQARIGQMYPAARLLVRAVRDAGAQPVFFITWAHRDGFPENGLRDYGSMQSEIDAGYMRIAQELDVPVVPVGYAWLRLMGQNPHINLWQDDGSHPNEAGTYLAACVFYAAFFHTSPEGLGYLAGLPAETAQSLQKIAADTVLTGAAQWHLP